MGTHIEDIHKKRKFRCFDCKITFAKRTHLFKHRKEVHKTRADHKCPHCDYSADIRSVLDSHIRHRHDRSKLVCPHCPFASADGRLFNQHIDQNHSNIKFDPKKKLYACPNCKYTAGNLRLMDIHRGKAHGISKVFTCSVCHASFSTRQYLRRH